MSILLSAGDIFPSFLVKERSVRSTDTWLPMTDAP